MTRPSPGASASFVVINTALLWATTAIAAAAFWPVYEHPRFVLMVAVTMVAGTVIAVLGALFRWRSPLVLLAGIAAFLLLGVPLAVPGKAALGVLPTPDGLLDLVVAAGLGWKQLLTITLPVGTYQGLLVPAFVLVLSTVVVGLSVALRSRVGELAAVAPLALLLLALSFGPNRAPLALPLVLAFLVVTLGWLSWRRWFQRREAIRTLAAGASSAATVDGAAPPARAERTGGLRTVGAAVLILAVAASTGVGAVGLMPPRPDRGVLRDVVERPFDPREYASPLAGLRRYHQPDVAEQALLSVTGLPSGARLRLATLDTYDGVVYTVGSAQVSSESGAFTRVPTAIDRSGVGGETVAVEVAVLGYEGIWIPTLGMLERIDFGGTDASALQDSFFFNDTSGTAVTVDGLASGDAYTLRAVVPDQPTEVQRGGLTPGGAAVPVPAVLPDELALALDRWVSGADTPGEKLQAMLTALSSEGYISHGVAPEEPSSRSGHAADRITQLLTDGRMIGDEEQYAVTAALMAGAIGFPSRVVFGFAPGEAGSGEAGAGEGEATLVQGSDISAWIEVHTQRYGWVTIDPTPAVREIPEEEPEEPAQVARPQTPVPPPMVEPDTRQDQKPLDDGQDDEASEDPLMEVLLAALAVIGVSVLVVGVILSPFLAVIAAKVRRRQLRYRAPTAAQRISGGWREFEDAVIDYGMTPPASPTRSEVAHTVGGLQPLVLASVADRAAFAPERAEDHEAVQVWTAVQELTTGLGAGRTRWQRLKAMISLRSLGGYSLKGLLGRERRAP